MAGRNEFYDDQSFVANSFTQNAGKTMLPPEEDRYAATVPVQEARPMESTVPFNGGMPATDLAPKTEIAGVIEVNGKRVAQTVGWLVCIQGACKGVDFHLHNGFNYIGNSSELDVCIPDAKVSRKAMVSIAFDEMGRSFTLMRCEGTTNIARCNGAPVYTPIALNIYDVITLGDTQLMFVPLCGEKFNWEEEENKE